MTTQIRSCEIALHEYIAALNHAEEEERRRIARELHDDTVQMLVALMHQVEKCERSTDDPAMLARHLDGIRTLIVETLDRTRRLIYNLRPFYLDDLGLTAALELLARDIERETPELRIQIHVQGDPRRLSGDLELAAFRVVQEGLTNIVRHAKAHHADVWLDFGTECLTLHVRDDGQGFAVPQDLEDLAFAKHFGLMGMRERVTRFGGQMVVKSQLGQGTTLTVTLPYQARVAF